MSKDPTDTNQATGDTQKAPTRTLSVQHAQHGTATSPIISDTNQASEVLPEQGGFNERLDEMSKKCEHDIEYGQEMHDLLRAQVQMRCTKCGYQSYTLFRSMYEALWIARLKARKEATNE